MPPVYRPIGHATGTRLPCGTSDRRSGQVVRDRPSPVVGWADIPGLSTCVGCCSAAWLQSWLQSRRNGADPQPLVVFKSVRGPRPDGAATCPLGTRGWPVEQIIPRISRARPLPVRLPVRVRRPSPIGLTGAALFAAAEVSRIDSRVRKPGTLPCARCPAARSVLDAAAEAYHHPAAVWWGPMHLPWSCRGGPDPVSADPFACPAQVPHEPGSVLICRPFPRRAWRQRPSGRYSGKRIRW